MGDVGGDDRMRCARPKAVKRFAFSPKVSRVSAGGDDFDGEALEVAGFGNGDEHRVVGALAVFR